MTFRDKEYALSIWTPDKIAYLEEAWTEQKEGWYNLLRPLIPDENHEVLDVGCGIGVYYDLLTEKAGQYIGIDPTDAMIERAKELHPDGNFKVGTVYDLQFPNNWFDLVFCWSVLIHLPHNTIKRAIRELWRVTKKHLLFNLYTALDEDSFSATGPWKEYLTAMGKWDLHEILQTLRPTFIQRTDYENIDFLDGRRFQRMIFLLRKNK